MNAVIEMIQDLITTIQRGHSHYLGESWIDWLDSEWIDAGHGEQKISVYECLKCGDHVRFKANTYRRKQ